MLLYFSATLVEIQVTFLCYRRGSFKDTEIPKEGPPQMANRKHDLVEYPIQDNVRLESYWRDDAGGRGPAASLYVYDDEIMRFDCFGGDNGHCHFNLRQTRGRRWMYPEGSFQDHIQQSLFDLRTNLNFCLRTHQDERVQEVKIERENLEQAAQQMESHLLVLADKLQDSAA